MKKQRFRSQVLEHHGRSRTRKVRNETRIILEHDVTPYVVYLSIFFFYEYIYTFLFIYLFFFYQLQIKEIP